jgi:hypothetical protein
LEPMEGRSGGDAAQQRAVAQRPDAGTAGTLKPRAPSASALKLRATQGGKKASGGARVSFGVGLLSIEDITASVIAAIVPLLS